MDEGLTISLFFESWELFRDPTLAGTLAGGTLGFLGVYVVIRRMVFLSAALSQIAGFGIALTFWAKLTLGLSGFMFSPYLGAFTATLTGIYLVGRSAKRRSKNRDALLGSLYLIGAAGTLALGTRIVEEVQDIQSLLFGSAVAILPEDFTVLVGTFMAIGILHAWWWRGFVLVSMDPADAHIRGINTRVVDAALLASIALALSVTTHTLGALPAFAFSVLPAMAALRIARNVSQALLLSAFIGAISGFTGYLLAFLYELPVGASQTIVGTVFVLITFGLTGHKHR